VEITLTISTMTDVILDLIRRYGRGHLNVGRDAVDEEILTIVLDGVVIGTLTLSPRAPVGLRSRIVAALREYGAEVH
jgi:hypothetical protein